MPLSRAGGEGWLLRSLGTDGRFTALVFGDGDAADASLRALAEADLPLRVLRIPLDDFHALAAQRYDAQPGTTYLLRPDQHVCARWRGRAPERSAPRTHAHSARPEKHYRERPPPCRTSP